MPVAEEVKSLAIKEKVTKLYYRKSMRVIAGVEPGKILLQIIAADAYTTDEEGNITPNANSAGGVDVEGDLDFDGINLLLAGLYLS